MFTVSNSQLKHLVLCLRRIAHHRFHSGCIEPMCSRLQHKKKCRSIAVCVCVSAHSVTRSILQVFFHKVTCFIVSKTTLLVFTLFFFLVVVEGFNFFVTVAFGAAISPPSTYLKAMQKKKKAKSHKDRFFYCH